MSFNNNYFSYSFFMYFMLFFFIFSMNPFILMEELMPNFLMGCFEEIYCLLDEEYIFKLENEWDLKNLYKSSNSSGLFSGIVLFFIFLSFFFLVLIDLSIFYLHEVMWIFFDNKVTFLSSYLVLSNELIDFTIFIYKLDFFGFIYLFSDMALTMNPLFNSAGPFFTMCVVISFCFEYIEFFFNWLVHPEEIMMSSGILDDLSCLFPEVSFLIFTLLIFFYSFILGEKEYKKKGFKNLNSTLIFFSKILVLFTIGVFINYGQMNYITFNQFLVSSEIMYYIKILILFLFLFFLIGLEDYMKWSSFYSYEFMVLFLFIIFSFILMISTNNFLTLYILMEMYGLSMYSIMGLKKDSLSVESSMKYFMYGAFSSIMFLFSMSLIYGFSGLNNFNDLNLFFFKNENIHGILYFSIMLLALSFLFKMAAGPFYLWAIDVYSSSPLMICFFLLLIPKIIFSFIFLKIFLKVFLFSYYLWSWIFLIFILVTSLMGVMGAIYQKSFKKIMIYGSIYNISFFLIPFYLVSGEMLMAWFFFIFTYLLNILSIFFIILSLKKLSSTGKYFNNFKDLFNLFKQSKLLSIVLSVNILSLAGLPPFAGFYGKLFYFYSMINNSSKDLESFTENDSFFIFVFIYLNIMSLIGLFYYISLVSMILISNKKTPAIFFKNLNYSFSMMMSFLFLLNIFFFFFVDDFLYFSNYFSLLFFN